MSAIKSPPSTSNNKNTRIKATMRSALIPTLILLFIPSPVPSKFIIEPCNSTTTCPALLSYRLPSDSELFEISARFQTPAAQILAASGLDPSNPPRIVPESAVLRVPTACGCDGGIRRSTSTVHRVRGMDTVESIAAGYGGLVSAGQIREVNGLTGLGLGRVEIGSSLVIPLPCFCFDGRDDDERVVYASHVVGEGEGLEGVGDMYGTTVTDLVAVNGLGSGLVEPGDVIAVPVPGQAS